MVDIRWCKSLRDHGHHHHHRRHHHHRCHHHLEVVGDMRVSWVSYAEWFSKLSYLYKYKDSTPRNTNGNNYYKLEVQGISGPRLLGGCPSGPLTWGLRALRPCDPRTDASSTSASYMDVSYTDAANLLRTNRQANSRSWIQRLHSKKCKWKNNVKHFVA